MEGTEWGVDAQGMGLRGYANATATKMFEGKSLWSIKTIIFVLMELCAENLYQFRKSAPLAPTVFNWGPDTFAESITRRVPLKEDCTNKPGRLIVSVYL
jgi:hypothetical protein